MPTTTRAALRYPVLSDTPDVPRDIGFLAADADAIFAIYGQGTLASRPTSSGGTPGKTGRHYYATDTGHFYYDFGTGWTDIGPVATSIADRSIAAIKIVADSLTAAEIAPAAIGTSEHADDSVTGVKINSALKPSQGAAGGTEALRALGTAAGTAAAGTHASQHSRTGADPLVVSSFIGSGTLATRPSTGLVSGMVYTATDTFGGTSYVYNGSTWVAMGKGVTETSLPLTPDVLSGPTSPGVGGTYTITAPVAGTYIVSFGAPNFAAGGQGSNSTISNSLNGVVCAYGDVSPSAGIAQFTATLTAGQVITFTIGGANGSSNAWARLTRIA